jgi:hypothetical protein
MILHDEEVELWGDNVDNRCGVDWEQDLLSESGKLVMGKEEVGPIGGLYLVKNFLLIGQSDFGRFRVVNSPLQFLNVRHSNRQLVLFLLNCCSEVLDLEFQLQSGFLIRNKLLTIFAVLFNNIFKLSLSL